MKSTLTNCGTASGVRRTGRQLTTVQGIAMDHLSAADAELLRKFIALDKAPISAADRLRLRRDVQRKHIAECARRKGLEVGESWLRREACVGARHFELGCWLFFYSSRVGSCGAWSRIDCIRRLLLSTYVSFNPQYDFATVFDFGERQFDTCFEMGDSELVMRSLAGLRSIERVAEKFAEAGWSEDYLVRHGYVEAGRRDAADGMPVALLAQGQMLAGRSVHGARRSGR